MPEMNRLPAMERYQRDVTFHALVDMMAAMIEAAEYTPTEIREAAILAATMVEQRSVRHARLFTSPIVLGGRSETQPFLVTPADSWTVCGEGSP